MDDIKRARTIIEEILNHALNRHIHVLSDAGYLRSSRHSKDYGFEGDKARPTLKLKHDLINEICRKFEPAIADYLKHPREQLWPVHDAQTVEDQLKQNFPK